MSPALARSSHTAMLAEMIEGFSDEDFLAPDIPDGLLAQPLPADVAARVVERLKNEADRHWYIDPRRSLEFADRIITIGQNRNDQRQTALGLMARGDALKFIGQTAEAWDALERAGATYRAAGDQVGWARTRIGRLYAGLRLNRTAEALSDVAEAAAILAAAGEHEKLLRLDLQTADVYNCLGRYPEALDLFRTALEIADGLGQSGRRDKGVVYLNMGAAYFWQGELAEALAAYERARDVAVALGESLNVALAESNQSEVLRTRGQYRQALLALERAIEHAQGQRTYQALFKYDMIDCYLQLNRYPQARDLAREAVRDFRALENSYDLARTLLHLAVAEAATGDLEAATNALAEADGLFDRLQTTSGSAGVQLWRSQITLKQGRAAAAQALAQQAAARFEATGQRLDYATAMLLVGRTAWAQGDGPLALATGKIVLDIARRSNAPALRYAAHTLLGQVEESQNHTRRARRHYHAAEATLGRVQRHLTITLRPDFLEDKNQASRALIALHLKSGEAEQAFAALERSKAQMLFNYLVNHDQLIWQRDGDSGRLVEELERLRSEHHWLYRLAHEPSQQRAPGAVAAMSPAQARVAVAERERRMRAITEQLYLHAGRAPFQSARSASLADIQLRLNANTTLVEYFNDGEWLWAWVVTAQRIAAQRLPISRLQAQHWLGQLHQNVHTALQVSETAPTARPLMNTIRRILQRLHAALIAPLGLTDLPGQRLIFVPTGPLYSLPFHALHNGSAYLIEDHEVVVYPAASLLCQPAPQRTPGVLALAHSWEGRLPNVWSEAGEVRKRLGGFLYAEDQATRSVLERPPVQVLHIAAHGQHRLDQPELSFLQLADGQLYADDLFQQDLSYELVTLSACETGQVNVVANDELIGLGRGFLYAGAGALILSLWPVADQAALQTMKLLYQNLSSGVSKAAALRATQVALIAENPDRHPAFWAAFQLVGNAEPLSTPPHA